jgi:hypothetical protein
MEIEGLGSGKDFKLYPGGGRAWEWSETGMRHSPGIRPADAEELIEHGATEIVLSRGMESQLEVSRLDSPAAGRGGLPAPGRPR